VVGLKTSQNAALAFTTLRGVFATYRFCTLLSGARGLLRSRVHTFLFIAG
jgi:hypothetical protein